jgi:DNA-binding NtrC family response regulator
MSTQPVIPPARLPITKRVHLVKPKPAKKEPAPFCVTRKPLPATADAMRYSASTTLKENFNYLQAVALYRWELIQAALAAAKGVKKHAAAQLGISRAALNAYLKRGGDVL